MIGERELWAAIDSLRESMGEHHGTGVPAWEQWCEENGVNWEELRAAANAYLPSFKTWLDESCLAEAAVDMWLHAFQVAFVAVAKPLRNQGAEEERARIRKACAELKTYRPLIDGDSHMVVLVEALENALDDLEGER